MKTHNLIQGTPEWAAHRAAHFNASDAPAMMGMSKYKKRSELLQELATGITAEVGADTQRRFDDGHTAEALARPLAEQIIGEELYPVVGSEGRLSASFDGLTIAENICFEHKSLNDDIRACKTAADLHPMYRIQMEQQLALSGAEKCLFMATKWNGDELVEKREFWYESDPKLRAEIVAGWAQFAEDLANYKPVEVIPAAVAAPITALPSVSIQVNGSVALVSNLALFEEKLQGFIEGIPKKPSTDQEFADCKAACNTLKEAQEALDAAEAHALGQVASFDEMKRTKAMLFNLARDTRLAVEKLVTAREKQIKEEVVAGGKTAFDEHIAGLNKRLGKPYMPAVPADFAGAIKNKRTIASLRDSVDTELSRAKIAANAIADSIQINLATLTELASDHKHLFADTAQIVLKANDDLTALVKSRIAEFKEAEQKRLDAERAKIRAEEEAKAKADADARVAAEVKAAQTAAPVAIQQPAATPVQPALTSQAPAVEMTAAAPAPVGQTAVAITPPAASKPSVKLTPSGPRPTDNDIIKTLATRYNVSELKVIGWLEAMNLPSARALREQGEQHEPATA